MVSSPEDLHSVLSVVRSWPPEMRLTLAEELLRTLHPVLKSDGPRGLPASQVLGLGAGRTSPPDNATVKQWIHESRQRLLGLAERAEMLEFLHQSREDMKAGRTHPALEAMDELAEKYG